MELCQLILIESRTDLIASFHFPVTSTRFLGFVLNIWTFRSVKALVCGWYSVEKLFLKPILSRRTATRRFLHSPPWSLINVDMTPNILIHSRTTSAIYSVHFVLSSQVWVTDWARWDFLKVVIKTKGQNWSGIDQHEAPIGPWHRVSCTGVTKVHWRTV